MAKWWWIPMMLLWSGSVPAQTFKISARMFNQTGVSKGVLRIAEEEAAYALRTAGVEVRWLDCVRTSECAGDLGENDFKILIRAEASAGSSRHSGAEGLGMALLPADEPAAYAFAYYGEICRVADRNRAISPAEILGYVIAHEIGHLLLGPQHQDGTVMDRNFSKIALAMMGTRQLRFNRSQRDAEKMAGDRSVRAALLEASR